MQTTACDIRISDYSSYVCSSDLDLAGVLGRLALGVVEIGRNGDDRLLDLLAQKGFGGFLHLLKDEGRDLRRRIILAAGLDPGVAVGALRSEEHTSKLQSLMRISYAVFCLKKKTYNKH